MLYLICYAHMRRKRVLTVMNSAYIRETQRNTIEMEDSGERIEDRSRKLKTISQLSGVSEKDDYDVPTKKHCFC